MSISTEKKLLKYFNSWIAFTLALYYFGPIPWNGAQYPLLFFVVVAYLLSFNMGVLVGHRMPTLPATRFRRLNNARWKWFIAIGFMMLSAFHIYTVTGKNIFNPLDYSFNFGIVYSSYQDFLKEKNAAGGIENILLILKAIMMPAAVLLMVVSFREKRSLFLLLSFPILASSIMRGTDKEFFDLLIYVIVLYYFHGMLGRRFVFIILLIVVSLILFEARKFARFDGNLPRCLPGTPNACFDFNSWIAVNVSPTMEFLKVMFTNYLSQGYEGMSRALSIPFEFNWGLGHLPPIKTKVCQILQLLCETQTYNERLQSYGWDTRYKWTTAYTAIASDFHWLFVPVYLFTMGAIFGASEKSWRINRDNLSLTCAVLITMFIVYSSANMQLTVSVEWSFVYFSLLGWQLKRVLVARPMRVAPVHQYQM